MQHNGFRRRIYPLDRRLDKALLALQAAMEGTALVKAVFRVLKASVRCDFVNVCLRNVRTESRTMSFRMIDSRGRDFSSEMLQGVFFREHPGMPLLMANPGIRFINTREVLAPEHILRQTRFYREVMQVIGFRHAVGMFFWNQPPDMPEAIFSLLRVDGQADFDDAEVASLKRLYPHIDAAMTRVRTAENKRTAYEELHAFARRAARAVCILDWDLRIADVTPRAREICALWQQGSNRSRKLKLSRFLLPPLIREVCDQLKNTWHESLHRRPTVGVAAGKVVRHPSVPGMQAAITLRLAKSTPTAKPGFVIEFEEPYSQRVLASRGRQARRHLSPAAILTEREREVSRLVCEGKSNQEIALQTHLAVGTIKNVLRVIFSKIGVPNRTTLSTVLRTP